MKLFGCSILVNRATEDGKSAPARVVIKNIRIVVCLSASLILSCFPGESKSGGFEHTPQGRVVYADLVVRGIIQELRTEVVTRTHFVSDDGMPDSPFPITNLNLEVLEVIKGHWQHKALQVVVPGGFPDGVVNDSGVIVVLHGDGYDHTYNYSLGDEVILTLYFLTSMKGGSYLVVSDEGRYLKVGAEWINQGTKDAAFTIDEIREFARGTKLETLFQEADLIGIGTVESILVDRSLQFSEIERMTVKIGQLWKGALEDEKVRVRMVRRGGNHLTWKAPVPRTAVGEEWIFFLKRDNEGYYPFAGTNGLLKVEGTDLIRNNRVKYGLSEPQLVNRLVNLPGRENTHDR